MNEVKLHEILENMLLQDAETKECLMSDFSHGKERLYSGKMLLLQQRNSIAFLDLQKAEQKIQ